MAAIDIDSAHGKNHAGSPDARDARGKSPRDGVAARRSSPDTVAEAKAANAADVPERRVLFADSETKRSEENDVADAVDDFGEDSEDEAGAIMPTQAAPERDRDDEDGETGIGTEIRRTSLSGFARSVASGLGAVGIGVVAAAFTPVARRRDLEDSALKGDSPGTSPGASDSDAQPAKGAAGGLDEAEIGRAHV